ncbi:MAG: type I restriction enzyme HsdR N-terminal domain-containing protein [Planctomycetaceae bacterium]|jgi:16S rRNA G966 N2-methylase RsmD|nr:type I restriction enzyme HsdR N-terminal domain-containing protein [Planctomycetaceae bacterium]
MTHFTLFGNIDFTTIAADPEFKEASVRSFIIDPIIKELGYTEENIVLEKTIHIQTGSKKQTNPYYADYALKVGNCFVCVIEAKSTEKNVADIALIDQAFSYASHREIRSNYFVICNGLEIALYKTDLDRSLLLRFHLSEINKHWSKLKRYLCRNSFIEGKVIQYEKPQCQSDPHFDYAKCRLLNEIQVKKQAAKRHFGCTAYFTRQVWNVVAEYIRNYSKTGDVILDPFGGSGVTAIEALMNSRKAIHVDLNPLSTFIVDSLIAPVNIADLQTAFDAVVSEYSKKEPKTKTEIKEALQKYKQPKDLPLPKNADVTSVHKLFTNKQRAQLSLLKSLIKKQKDKNIQKALLLAFYNTLSVINLTFHETPNGGGNHFGFYYRYRMAKKPALKETLTVFEGKFKRILDGKKEIAGKINNETINNATIVRGTATNLSFLPDESVDYIYTDPPYGKNIQYLDLSTMWNAWLDLDVSKKDYKLEAIEDGELEKSKEEYKQLIAQSIKEMFRVLKFDRWLSFVFAHKDPEFWDLIIVTAESCGFEYIGAVSQKNGQTSFKKRQRPWKTLSGQLIINFRKVATPRTLMRANLGMDMSEVIIQTIEGLIAKNDGATLEQINDELIRKGLELGFLDLLAKKYSDISPLLQQNFRYNKERDVFTIPVNQGFKSHIDVNVRIMFYLKSCLTRYELEGKDAHFDNIVLEIMPLLKNGKTPTHQTILNVLEYIAERVGDDCWKLKKMSEQKEFSWETQKTV